jgi:hypothetical protein
MTVSHKKMSELQTFLSEKIVDDNLREDLYKYFKEFVKYDENKRYPYDKEKYEKYDKKYYEKNKEKIKKAVTERRRNKRLDEKKNILNIENSLSVIKI